MDIKDFKAPRTHDKEIMRVFLQAGFWKTELQILNKCRMSFKAIYVSDICNGSSMEIEQQYWEGNWNGLSSQYQWPQTIDPTTAEWQVRQQSLTKALELGCN